VSGQALIQAPLNSGANQTHTTTHTCRARGVLWPRKAVGRSRAARQPPPLVPPAGPPARQSCPPHHGAAAARRSGLSVCRGAEWVRVGESNRVQWVGKRARKKDVEQLHTHANTTHSQHQHSPSQARIWAWPSASMSATLVDRPSRSGLSLPHLYHVGSNICGRVWVVWGESLWLQARDEHTHAG
jgi:hypothetical protein